MLLDLSQCESQIEEDLAIALDKHLSDSAELIHQMEVRTHLMTFYIDIVVKTGQGINIGIECDGKESHQDPVRDKCRDALILGTKIVAAVYRFRGYEIHYRRDDCLYHILKKDPYVFSERGRRNIGMLASEQIKEALGEEAMAIAAEKGPDWNPWIFYKRGKKRDRVVLDRRSLQDGRSFYSRFLAFVDQNKAYSFDELVEACRRRR